MQSSATLHGNARVPWNKGKLIGQKPPLKVAEIWTVRTQLRLVGRWPSAVSLACTPPNSRAETAMPRPGSLIDGERIRKARTLRRVEPVYEHLAVALAAIPTLRFVKLLRGRLSASNRLSTDGKKNPVVAGGAEGITGVELLVDTESQIMQFYAITSAEKGVGRQIVEAVVGVTPADWLPLAVPMDWSGGFWERMARDYPRLQVF